MPSLIELYQANADLRDQFEILAFHDARASSIEQAYEKLRKNGVMEKRWGGQPLPFPVVLDSSGDTIEQWGIQRYPTIVLVNPEGHVVKGGLAAFEKQLKKLREATTDNKN